MDAVAVQETAAWVAGRGFRRVALQFPDDALGDAVAATQALQAACGSVVTVFLLADTTFGRRAACAPKPHRTTCAPVTARLRARLHPHAAAAWTRWPRCTQRRTAWCTSDAPACRPCRGCRRASCLPSAPSTWTTSRRSSQTCAALRARTRTRLTRHRADAAALAVRAARRSMRCAAAAAPSWCCWTRNARMRPQRCRRRHCAPEVKRRGRRSCLVTRRQWSWSPLLLPVPAQCRRRLLAAAAAPVPAARRPQTQRPLRRRPLQPPATLPAWARGAQTWRAAARGSCRQAWHSQTAASCGSAAPTRRCCGC